VDEPVRRFEQVRLAAELLPAGRRDVLAVDDDLVERDDPGDLAGEVPATDAGPARPGRLLAPRGRERRQPIGDPGAPVRPEPGRIGTGALAAGDGVLVAAAVNAIENPSTWSSKSPRPASAHGVGRLS
jgi:hypothetical protein